MAKRFVFGLWHGGISYGAPDIACDLERFPNVARAEQALADRQRYGSRWVQEFDYVSRPSVRVLTPNADYGSRMDIFVVRSSTEAEALALVLSGELSPRRVENEADAGSSALA